MQPLDFSFPSLQFAGHCDACGAVTFNPPLCNECASDIESAELSNALEGHRHS